MDQVKQQAAKLGKPEKVENTQRDRVDSLEIAGRSAQNMQESV
jgi:hypothetical protein